MIENTDFITVIVPYYQKTPGILADSINCVARQDVLEFCRIEVIVIDDSSPIPAESELENISHPSNFSLRIIHQPNLGPAAARNCGLANIGSGAKFVAFLDSDDFWSEDHLSRAIVALGNHYDFYFSDFYQLDQNISAFNRAGKIDPLDHPKLEAGNDFYLYQGDMVTQIITGNVIGTSTVVYRFSSAPDLRFREEFFNAGEDYLFWIDFCQRHKKIVFSSIQECTYGKGVNIYSGAEWGTLALMDRILNELKYRRLLLSLVALNPETEIFVQKKVNTLRLEFCRQIIHRVRKGKGDILSRLIRAHRIDPRLTYFFPLYLIQSVYKSV